MKYSIFHHIVESNIPLPELQEDNSAYATIFFNSTTISEVTNAPIEWFHHWRLPDGQISISVGRKKEAYWLRFPHIADFKVSPHNNKITSYRVENVPDNTIRHLLLDQVIPRLISHQGNQVIHASCVSLGGSAIAFSGESGWGKSTLAAFFLLRGHTILTDDCLLLEQVNSGILATPNYQCLRLLQDTLTLLPQEKNAVPVAHYGTKKRLVMNKSNCYGPISLKAIYILTDPTLTTETDTISIKQISGANAAISLVKNTFLIDITNKKKMGEQLQSLAMIAGSKSLSIYQLTYPRRIDVLPKIFDLINNTHLRDER